MDTPRILVADDEEQIRRLYRKLLSKAGFSVVDVASGKEALKLLGIETFEVIVLDLSMPDMDGFDVLRLIRERWPTQRTLVISGVMAGKMLGMAAHLGATATLDKILAPSFLVETVNRLLSEAA